MGLVIGILVTLCISLAVYIAGVFIVVGDKPVSDRLMRIVTVSIVVLIVAILLTIFTSILYLLLKN